MRYLPLILTACACDAGTRQRDDVCVPHEMGPSYDVTHSDGGPFVLGDAELLDKIGFGRTSPARLSEVDSDLWHLVKAFCRPCTIPGDAKPIHEMFPVAYLPQAVGAGCFSLTLVDGRVVYGDLRSRFDMSTAVVSVPSDELLTQLRRIRSATITSEAQYVAHSRLAERVVNEQLLVGLRKPQKVCVLSDASPSCRVGGNDDDRYEG